MEAHHEAVPRRTPAWAQGGQHRLGIRPPSARAASRKGHALPARAQASVCSSMHRWWWRDNGFEIAAQEFRDASERRDAELPGDLRVGRRRSVVHGDQPGVVRRDKALGDGGDAGRCRRSQARPI